MTGTIRDFIDAQQTVLAAIGPELDPVRALSLELLSGGKRLRPAFCYWSYLAATDSIVDHEPLLAAAASLDLLHVSALVHDDVMDASDLRRGRPAAHRQFDALHRGSGWLGDSETFGRAGAILLGDLLLMWSSELLHGARLDPQALARALPVLEAMRTEVTCGQYLDVVAQSHNPSLTGIDRALDEANRVVEFKSARYTVQRPCQFGASLGGAPFGLYQALGDYGSPLGRAFQFRDDLLGVFGDSELTGKPAGDDLREGKRTVLIAHAYAKSGAAARAELDRLIGDRELDLDGIVVVQGILTESGAKEAVESMINSGHQQALEALAGVEMTESGRTALTVLADAAVHRVH